MALNLSCITIRWEEEEEEGSSYSPHRTYIRVQRILNCRGEGGGRTVALLYSFLLHRIVLAEYNIRRQQQQQQLAVASRLRPSVYVVP